MIRISATRSPVDRFGAQSRHRRHRPAGQQRVGELEQRGTPLAPQSCSSARNEHSAAPSGSVIALHCRNESRVARRPTGAVESQVDHRRCAAATASMRPGCSRYACVWASGAASRRYRAGSPRPRAPHPPAPAAPESLRSASRRCPGPRASRASPAPPRGRRRSTRPHPPRARARCARRRRDLVHETTSTARPPVYQPRSELGARGGAPHVHGRTHRATAGRAGATGRRTRGEPRCSWTGKVSSVRR
jgi:hypothetical protein